MALLLLPAVACRGGQRRRWPAAPGGGSECRVQSVELALWRGRRFGLLAGGVTDLHRRLWVSMHGHCSSQGHHFARLKDGAMRVYVSPFSRPLMRETCLTTGPPFRMVTASITTSRTMSGYSTWWMGRSASRLTSASRLSQQSGCITSQQSGWAREGPVARAGHTKRGEGGGGREAVK